MEAAPALNGDVLRAAREAAGLTQTELARLVGVVDGQRISKWERGAARPRSAPLLAAVGDALGLRPREMLADPGEEVTLRWLRFAAGLTVEQLAAAVHVSTPTVKRWESEGLKDPSTETIRAVATALDADAAMVRVALSRDLHGEREPQQ